MTVMMTERWGRRTLGRTVSTTPRVFCQAEISFKKNPMYLLVIIFCS